MDASRGTTQRKLSIAVPRISDVRGLRKQDLSYPLIGRKRSIFRCCLSNPLLTFCVQGTHSEQAKPLAQVVRKCLFYRKTARHNWNKCLKGIKKQTPRNWLIFADIFMLGRWWSHSPHREPQKKKTYLTPFMLVGWKGFPWRAAIIPVSKGTIATYTTQTTRDFFTAHVSKVF